MNFPEDNIVIALDPSGNYTEGKGTTGFAISNNGYIYATVEIAAAEYPTQMSYWEAILNKIDKLRMKYHKIKVVCEDYRLYASASEAQINSNLETPQLIGAIKYHCYEYKIPIIMQMAAEVKDRWSNEVLLAKGVLTEYAKKRKYIGRNRLGKHDIDAVRHLIHYNTFKAHPKKNSPPTPHFERAYY
jgi:hypothetical protein